MTRRIPPSDKTRHVFNPNNAIIKLRNMRRDLDAIAADIDLAIEKIRNREDEKLRAQAGYFDDEPAGDFRRRKNPYVAPITGIGPPSEIYHLVDITTGRIILPGDTVKTTRDVEVKLVSFDENRVYCADKKGTQYEWFHTVIRARIVYADDPDWRSDAQ